jgi:hypothetical protein
MGCAVGVHDRQDNRVRRPAYGQRNSVVGSSSKAKTTHKKTCKGRP